MLTPDGKLIFALAALAVVAACAPETREPDVSAAEGERLYFQKCAACHGNDGTGAGVASLGLGGPPPDLTTLAARNDDTFPETFVMSVIDGFNRRDHPSSAMPEFGNEDLGPIVQVEEDGVSTPIPSDLIALSAYLESIQR
ncbi:cytochrome c [Tateyamaria omphalii]|uniref:c-type cytochrome n=1 Tax=Tateyamaria omphalii TaxID=299262 RepID=UPI001C99CE4E|nr:cytochrome c [Tateyamaria omphalii]MBY5931927.1 cytochrome c [Tateyamaria omphalii]